jgi:hypothetical protein
LTQRNRTELSFAGSAALFVALAGCSGSNERSERFSDYAALKTSRYADDLPSMLVPPSGHDIRVVYHLDSTEIEAGFAFDRGDAERVISPFRSPDQIRLHELEVAGMLPPSRVRDPLFVRCRDWGVEYLQILGMTQARYWTSHDQKLRKLACTSVRDGPMISL